MYDEAQRQLQITLDQYGASQRRLQSLVAELEDMRSNMEAVHLRNYHNWLSLLIIIILIGPSWQASCGAIAGGVQHPHQRADRRQLQLGIDQIEAGTRTGSLRLGLRRSHQRTQGN